MHWLLLTACFRSPPPTPEPEAEPEPAPSGLRLAVMRPDGEQCIWEHTDPTASQPPVRIATLPAPCASDYLIAQSGDAALLTMEQVAVRVDLKTGTASRLPAPGRTDLRLATAEWDGDQPILWASFEGEPAWIEEPSKGQYTLDGTTYPFEGDEYAGQTLCVKLGLSGGAWTVREARVELLYEGMSPPFCGNTTGALHSPEDGSGEGGDTFAYAQEGQEPGLDALPADSTDGWVYAHASPRAALKSMWFEGQRLHGPLALRKADDTWFIPDGFAHDRSLLVQRFDDLLLACDHEKAALFSLSDGQQRWSQAGPCPIQWPLHK